MAVIECRGRCWIEIDGWPHDERPVGERESMKAAYRKRYGLPDDYEKPPVGALGQFLRDVTPPDIG